jgi:hypothetical protein
MDRSRGRTEWPSFGLEEEEGMAVTRFVLLFDEAT